MPRTHGYSKKGTRCYGIHNWNEKGRTNVIGALLDKKLLTCSLWNCNINTDIFLAWVKQDLLPKLPKNSVVVMDNASFHKREDIKEAIKKGGHTLEYQPAYSPDLNPIEKCWAKIKTLRRKLQIDVLELFKLEQIYSFVLS